MEVSLRFFRLWLVLGLLIWHGYFFSQGNAIPLYVDLLAVTVVLGRLLWHRFGMPAYVAKHHSAYSYFPIAYAMVLTEECYAALVENINEGFTFSLYFTRVLEFWSFNLLAFTGVIVGMFILHQSQVMKRSELVIFAGVFGIYAEHAYTYISTNPLIFVVYAPIVVFIYYLIFSPALAMLSDDGGEVRAWPQLARYLVAVLTVFILSVPCLALIGHLRAAHPSAFPPCSMISC